MSCLPPEDPTGIVVAADADRDPERRHEWSTGLVSHASVWPIGRSSAGLPRTYRTLRSKHRRLRAFLRDAASGCGEVLKSVIVRLGDRLGLQKTGHYSSEVEERPAPPRAATIPCPIGPEERHAPRDLPGPTRT